MRTRATLLPILLAAAAATAAALAPPAAAHDCSATYCGPCVDGEDHVHSDSTGSCVSYEDRRPSWGGGVDAGAGRDGAWADVRATPGAGVLGVVAALGAAGLLVARRT